MRHHTIKTILLGDCDTGKTTLFQAFINGGVGQAATQPTIAFDCFGKELVLEGYGAVAFQLWDTSGAERFSSIAMTQAYYRHTDGVLLVFDVTRATSFAAISEVWLARLRSARQMPAHYRCVLVGNKCDLGGRVVSVAEALALAAQHGWDYCELSALHASPQEVRQPFAMLAVQLLDQPRELAESTEAWVLVDAPPAQPTQQKCC